MIVIFAFLLFLQIVSTVFPIILGSMVTAVSKSDLKAFLWAVCAWSILTGLRTLIAYLREKFEIKHLDYELSRYLSRISMEKFFTISMGQHHLGHSVIKQEVIRKGEAAISGTVYAGLYQLIPTILMIFLPIGFLLAKVPLVGICVLGAVCVLSTYTVRYNAAFFPKLRGLDSLSNTVSKKQGEIIRNADVVFVNAQEEKVRQEFDKENEMQAVESRPVWLSYVRWFYGGNLFISLAQAICLAVSGYLAYRGEMTSGMFVTVSMWIGSALGTLTNISHLQRDLAKNLAPVDKYFKFLDYEPDIVMPDRPIPIEELKGRIEFRRVSFAYRVRTDDDAFNDGKFAAGQTVHETEMPAVRGVSFVLEEGKRYAFVGRSGSGKSTLVGLILRAFDPQAGRVLIDGVDIRMLDYKELRRNVGLVPQDVSLFDGTMRYNITFGLNGSAHLVTDGDLDRVSRLSRISEFSEKLENGWETVIGERGIKLSGGQRQRVGIARALIKHPKILIFDEATSSLDTENEARIRESIEEASAGKTTIIIAHRLATVRDADTIFVFDEGSLVGQGSHEELLAGNEPYQRLVHNQVIMA